MGKSRFLKISIWLFLAAGFILFIGEKKWFPVFYDHNLFAAGSLVSAFAIILPAFIFRSNDQKKKESLLNFQVALSVSLMLNGGGALGLFQLYKIGFEYDKLVHFAVAFIATISLSHFLFRWYGLDFKKSVILSAVFLVFAGLVWELFEFLTDLILGTKTFGIYGMDIERDTKFDLIFDIFGAISASLFLFFRKNKNLDKV